MQSIRRRIRSIGQLDRLGPGLVAGAADDDPSGIATYSQAGAQFGFGLLWTLVLTFPLMAAIQLISAHIGRVTGHGLARSMGETLPGGVVSVLVLLLFVANTFNIGADVAAMGQAAQLVVGGSAHLNTVFFAVGSLLLQLFLPYRRYARFLKWLTLTLFAYVAVLFSIHLDWYEALRGLVWPRVGLTAATATVVVAVFGTTISPYLFFWQTAQEVEELESSITARPLTEAPLQAVGEFARMRFDTIVGMAFSNLIAIAIMIATAATLHEAGTTNIQTAAQAARALEPIAGKFAFLLFGMGIVGTGMLAIPVLAGSAAYAVGESRGWKCGLDHKPWEAVGFYSIVAAATLLGVGIQYSGVDPIKALFWSAVLNGLIAVPMMAAMMIVVNDRRQMGNFTASRRLNALGWLSTVVMADAACTMLIAV